MKKVVIVSAKRTAIGSFNGVLSSFSSGQLGSFAIKAILEDLNIELNLVDEVIMGNVLMGGQGQAPARQAAILAGLPNKTECMTINKMCGSGLKSVMLAQQAIALGDSDIIIAGGQESKKGRRPGIFGAGFSRDPLRQMETLQSGRYYPFLGPSIKGAWAQQTQPPGVHKQKH